MQKVQLFSKKRFGVTTVTPSVSRESVCVVPVLCHGAAFSCALHTRGVVSPGDSRVASRAGFIKNVLEDVGNLGEKTSERKKYCC